MMHFARVLRYLVYFRAMKHVLNGTGLSLFVNTDRTGQVLTECLSVCQPSYLAVVV